MGRWGIEPKAYAYPLGAGLKRETQVAAARAGYLVARGVHFRDWTATSPMILADGETAPTNWLYLPGVLIAQKNEPPALYFNDHATVAGLLRDALRRRAWIILVYHSVGHPDGWGYYPLNEFRKDLGTIVHSKFWVDHMENVACYAWEKQLSRVTGSRLSRGQKQATFELTLEAPAELTAICRQPLTVDMDVHSSRSYGRCVVTAPGAPDQAAKVTGNRFTASLDPQTKRYRVTCHERARHPAGGPPL
jgi:hypothetical protein